jgi:ubiquinone/menaquinone biosynthesis C-methylase UbiE
MVYLYKQSRLYAAFLTLFGYERGIGRFIDRLNLDVPNGCRILDVGCGSGILGLQLLQRFPHSTLLATDLEPNFLKTTLANAKNRGIEEGRVTVGVSDVSEPQNVTLLDGTPLVLQDHSFDIVSVGGVLGYSKDQVATLKTLLRLIKPGGHLVNLEMNESFAGKFISFAYSCAAIPMETMKDTIEREGHGVSVIPFSMADFPANLTRVGVIANVSPLNPADRFAAAPLQTPPLNLYTGPAGYDSPA